MDQFLRILSRHGWDRVGKPTERRWEFRHAGTGEEAAVAPGEIPFWAAQLEPAAIPATDGDWYAHYTAGLWFVRSKTGRRERGVSHDKQGYALFFSYAADTGRAVSLLNLHDQERMEQARMELTDK